VDQLLPLDGKGTILPHVVRIVAVLFVGNADDHHAFFGVHEKAALPARPDQILLLRVELHKGDFFNARIGPVLAVVPDGRDRPVGLPKHAHHKPLAELVQAPGKKRRRSPALRGNGKAVQFHQELADERPVAFVHLVVADLEFTGAQPEPLDLAVHIGRE